jgi:endoglucanase
VIVSERRLLQSILNQPTAPFREHYVRAVLERTARRLDLRVRRDRFGNLYIGYRQGRARPLTFTAHMDHPGFEVVHAGKRARALLLGGVEPQRLQGVRVRLYPDSESVRRAPPVRPPASVCGRIAAVHTSAQPGERRSRVEVEIACESEVQADAFGHFDLPSMELHGRRLHSKALDNLLSCALILATMARLRRRRAAADVLGVFTRAEEVGFVGAGGVLRATLLAPRRPLVVLETSKALPVTPIGAGPVLRVGDRMTAFDPGMDVWLAERASAVANSRKGFAYQRALMTGGACEASLFTLHGRRVGAIALPLGNYHNMTARGGIGAEYISTVDFDHAVVLLEDLSSNPPASDPMRARRRELDAIFARLGARLDEK